MIRRLSSVGGWFVMMTARTIDAAMAGISSLVASVTQSDRRYRDRD